MAKKKSPGEGSIREKRPGYWEARVALNGVRHHFTGKTKTEARQKMMKAIADNENGLIIEPNKLTVEEWLRVWLNHYARIGISEGTYSDYEQIIRNHLLPDLGQIKLSKLTAAEVQKLINEKLKSGLSPRTTTLILSVLKQALKQAALEGYVLRNVAEFVKAPRQVKKEARYLTPDETTVLLEEAKNNEVLFYLIILILGSGIRIGEAIALKWENLDLEEGILQVKASSRRIAKYDDDGNHVGTQVITKEPKTKAGRRSIPLPAWVVSNLKKWRKIQMKKLLALGITSSEYVVTNEVGKQLDDSNARHRLENVTKRIDMSDVGFHTLRHTYATRLLESGINPKTAQELLGHSTIAMTLDIYSHVMPDLKKEAVQKLNALNFVPKVSPIEK